MDALKNFIVGAVFIAAGVGAGMLGNYLGGGKTWVTIAMVFAGLAVGFVLAVLIRKLFDRAEATTRTPRRQAAGAAGRGKRTLSALFVLLCQLSCLAMFLALLPGLTLQSIINNNVLGMIGGALGSLIPWAILGYLVMRLVLRNRSDQTQARAGAVLSLVVVSGLFVFFWTAAERKPTLRADYWDAIARACEGTGVVGAAPYTEEPHMRTTVVIRAGSKFWYGDMPLEWIPSSIETTELVACVGDKEETVIQVCRYRGPSVTRYGYEREIRLVSALTGDVIAARSSLGKPPRECRASEDMDLTKLKGKDVIYSQVADWLGEHIER